MFKCMGFNFLMTYFTRAFSECPMPDGHFIFFPLMKKTKQKKSRVLKGDYCVPNIIVDACSFATRRTATPSYSITE